MNTLGQYASASQQASQYGTNIAAPPPNPVTLETIFAKLMSLCERTGKLVAEAESLANRLGGAVPTAAGTSGPPKDQSEPSMIDKLHASVRMLETHADMIGAALSRAHSHIG